MKTNILGFGSGFSNGRFGRVDNIKMPSGSKVHAVSGLYSRIQGFRWRPSNLICNDTSHCRMGREPVGIFGCVTESYPDEQQINVCIEST